MTNQDKSGVGVSWVVDCEGCALVLLELWVRIWDDASPFYQYRMIVRKSIITEHLEHWQGAGVSGNWGFWNSKEERK